MINLFNTTDKLQLVTSAVADVDVHASFMDMTQADPPVIKGTTSGRQNTVGIVTATTTDIVAAPAASTTRNVKTLLIRNKHATVPVDVTVVYDMNGTDVQLHKATLKAGEVLEFADGVGFYTITTPVLPLLMRCPDADSTGQNVATAQPWFPSLGSVTVVAATTYFMTGLLSMIRAAGVTSHTTGFLFGGTATLTSIQYFAETNTGDLDTTLAVGRTLATVATNTPVKAASTSATEAFSGLVHGVVRINAAGTFIPQFIYSAAPGGAPTIRKNSYLRLEPVGLNTFTALGPWS